MDILLERCRSEGCSLEAAVAEEITLEAERGQPRQHRQDARAIVRVGGLQFEIEQRAILVADHEQLHALDQFASINGACPSTATNTESGSAPRRITA